MANISLPPDKCSNMKNKDGFCKQEFPKTPPKPTEVKIDKSKLPKSPDRPHIEIIGDD